MALKTYAGTTLGKLGLAAIGKICAVPAATVILTVGTIALTAYAGALIIKEITDVESVNEETSESDRV